jgi:hypothetical protein
LTGKKFTRESVVQPVSDVCKQTFVAFNDISEACVQRLWNLFIGRKISKNKRESNTKVNVQP